MQLAAVGEKRSDELGRPLAGPRTSLLIVAFTDLEGSTSLARSLGDRRWVELLEVHDETVRAVTVRRAGRVVKAMGDGMLAVFSDAAESLRWAVDLQTGLARTGHAVGVGPLGLRVGLHAGPVVHRRGDVAGLTVHIASRITAIAAGGEVLASSIVRRRAADARDICFRSTRQLQLRGFDGVQVVHELAW